MADRALSEQFIFCFDEKQQLRVSLRLEQQQPKSCWEEEATRVLDFDSICKRRNP